MKQESKMKPVRIEEILKDISPEIIKKQINDIKKLDLERIAFDDVKKLVEPLVQCGFSIVTFPKGLPIFRCRSLGDNPLIKNISEVSYPPKKNLKKINRASRGINQIFYGAAHRMLGNTQFRHVAGTFEVSEFHKPAYTHKLEYLAFSRWKPLSDLRVPVIGLDSSIAVNNPEAAAIKDFQTKTVAELPDRFKVISLTSQFLSDEFSKVANNEFEYIISAAYCELLFDFGFPAIMYPSVQTEGHSFNIAIRKEVVDSNLECELAAIGRNQKIAGQIFLDYFLVSETIKNDGDFNWKEPPAKSTMSNLDKKLIEREIRENGGFQGKELPFSTKFDL